MLVRPSKPRRWNWSVPVAVLAPVLFLGSAIAANGEEKGDAEKAKQRQTQQRSRDAGDASGSVVIPSAGGGYVAVTEQYIQPRHHVRVYGPGSRLVSAFELDQWWTVSAVSDAGLLALYPATQCESRPGFKLVTFHGRVLREHALSDWQAELRFGPGGGPYWCGFDVKGVPTVEVMDNEGGTVWRHQWPEGRLEVREAAVAPDGKSVAVALKSRGQEGGFLEIHALDQGRMVRAPLTRREVEQIHKRPVFSDDGGTLYVVVGRARLRAYATRTGEPLWDADLGKTRAHQGVTTLLGVRPTKTGRVGVLVLLDNNDVALAQVAIKDGRTALFRAIGLAETDKQALNERPIWSQWRLVSGSFVIGIGETVRRIPVED